MAPPSATHLPSSLYRILVSPTLYVSPSALTLSLPPPLPHPLILWSSLPVREAGESVRGGGRGEGPGWKLRNVSPFDLRGGVSWFNYLLSSLGNPIKTFCGAKFNMCVGGREKGGGPNADFRGVSLLIPFLVISFFSPCCFGLGLPGLLSIFFVVLGYVSVGLYLQSQTGPVPETKGPLDWQWLGRPPSTEAGRPLLASISAHLGVRIFVRPAEGL